jgi:hypothetical protein
VDLPLLHLDTDLMVVDNLTKLQIIHHLLHMAMAANLEARIDIMANPINSEVVILTEDKMATDIEAVVIPIKGMVAIVEREQLVKQIISSAFVSDQCRVNCT